MRQAMLCRTVTRAAESNRGAERLCMSRDRRMVMRELDEEERSLLRALDGDIATPDLIIMVRDLGEILRKRGLVIQANVAELAADRLELLSTGVKA